MTRQSTENKNDFLHHLDAALSRTMRYQHLQEALFQFILSSANKVVSTHCVIQQDHLRAISRDGGLNQNNRSDIEQCCFDYSRASEHIAETLDEIDIVCSGVETVNIQAERIVSDLAVKLENEKKLAAIQAQNRKFDNDYKLLASNALLIICGTLLVGLSGGLATGEGAGLIIEGVDGLREVAGHDVEKHEEAGMPVPVNNELLTKFEEIEEKNRELFIESWMHLIEQHCVEQLQSIDVMSKDLPAEHPSQDSLSMLRSIYNEK